MASPFLGGNHSGSDMGLVRSKPTLGAHCHSNARRRCRGGWPSRGGHGTKSPITF